MMFSRFGFALAILVLFIAPLTDPAYAGAQESAPSEKSAESLDPLQQQAESTRQAGHLWRSAGLYRKALENNPAWIDGWWALGTIYYELDFFEEALEAFKKVLLERPEAPEAWALLGLCQYEVGEFEKSLESLAAAELVGIGENNLFSFVVRFRRAQLLSKFGQFEASSRVLSDLAALGNAHKPSIREALGIAALRLPYLPEELPADKREPVLLAGRALAYLSQNLPDDARAQFRDLTRRFPTLPNVFYIYGNFLSQTEPEEALGAYLKELENSPDHFPAHAEIVFDYLRRGEPAKAKPFAEKSILQQPEAFVGHLALGRTLLELGEIDGAIRELERSAVLAPDSPEAQFSLVSAYRKAGRKEEAETAGQKFQRLKELQEQRSGVKP